MNERDSPDSTPSDRILSLSGIVAPLVLLVAVTVSGSLQPNYSHVLQPISALGAEGAPYRAVLNYGGLIPAGLLTSLFSLAMFRHMKGKSSLQISAGLVALAGMGRFMAGIFPCDPGCVVFVSASAKVHAVAGVTALTAGAFAPLFLALGLRFRGSRYWYHMSLVLGLSALVTLAAAMSRLWPQYLGLLQRVLLTLSYTWIFILAIGIGIRRSPLLPGND